MHEEWIKKNFSNEQTDLAFSFVYGGEESNGLRS